METLNVNNLPRHIFVGYRGENDTRGYAFDYSEWKEEHGDGELSINFQRPDDTVVYPITLIIEGSKAIWLPSLVDTKNEGSGEAQIVYTVGDKVAKTAVLAVHVSRSLGPAGEVPEPYEDVLDRLNKLAGETKQNADSAEESAASAAESASDAADSAASAAESAASIGDAVEIATQKAEEAASSASSAAESAQDALDSASDSADSATSAAESAAASATSAQNAAISASNAADSASEANNAVDDAEQAASQARGSAQNASASAQSASGSAQAAQQSAQAASASATNAANSATSSAQSASSASQSAQSAERSATSAGGSANAAALSAQNASTSETNASGSASDAIGAANAASNSATQAYGSAHAASLSAQDASQSEQEARRAELASKVSETSAANSALAAAQSAQEAEDVLESIPESYDELVDDMDNFKRDLVLVQETQPTSEDNRLWVVTDEGEEIQVPTYAEHLALVEAVEDLDERVELLEELEKGREYTPAQIQAIIASGRADKYFSIGDIINIEWTDYKPTTPVTYTVPHVVTHFGDVEDENGVTHPNAMWLMWMYATPQSLRFDAAEEIVADEETFQSGYYYYEKVNDDFVEREVTVGDPIPSGTEYCKHVRTGMSLRIKYGSSDWSQSAYRQWLNSKGGKGEWWVAQHESDVAPAEAASMPGFLTGYSNDWLEVFKPVKVTTVKDTICDGGAISTTYDKFFLPSLEQVYGVPEFPGVEGDYWEYWKNETGMDSPSDGGSSNTNDARKIPRISNPAGAVTVRLRSVERNHADATKTINASGFINGYISVVQHYAQPSCVIY